MDSLAQYERDAKQGRADALYNLGLAYSTGQGVTIDMVAAHKWFNLAAVRGVEAAKSWRNQIAARNDDRPDRGSAEACPRVAEDFQELSSTRCPAARQHRHGRRIGRIEIRQYPQRHILARQPRPIDLRILQNPLHVIARLPERNLLDPVYGIA